MSEAEARLKWLEMLLAEPLEGHIDTFVHNVLEEVLHGQVPSWVWKEGERETS